MNYLQKTQEILGEFLEMEPNEIPTDESLHDLGVDSLDMVEVIMMFEDEFDIEIPPEDEPKFNKIKISSIVEYLENLNENEYEKIN
jgi:acyl carrier protein